VNSELELNERMGEERKSKRVGLMVRDGKSREGDDTIPVI
jgi:hypothetical protein